MLYNTAIHSEMTAYCHVAAVSQLALLSAAINVASSFSSQYLFPRLPQANYVTNFKQ